jgi:hypothetical protein
MLKAVVIGLGVLIVIAFVLLAVGMVTKFNGHPASTSAQSGSRYALPTGAKILDMQTQPGRVILRVRTTAGEEVDIIDIQDGHLISQVKAGQ